MSEIDWSQASSKTVMHVANAMTLINRRRFDDAVKILNEVEQFIKSDKCPKDVASLIQKKLDKADRLLSARRSR